MSKIFKVSMRTIFRWILLSKTTGSVKKKEIKRFDRNKIKDLNLFKNFIIKNNDKSNKELAKLWTESTGIKVSASTIQRNIKKINYTFKKKHRNIKNQTHNYVMNLS